jgi:TetR/AcrR family transcriptional repressor of nem operon
MSILMTPDIPRDPNATDVALKEVFWRRGYENASIEDIVKATGMNRYALYNAYGGKRDLFLAALDAYYLERKAIFVKSLNDPDARPLDAIRRVFEFAIREMSERGAGCLTCNVANDIAPHDEIVADRIRRYLEEIRLAHTEALQRADTRGELNPNITPLDGAALLMVVKLGLGVHAKHGASGDDMLATFNAAMRSLTKASIQ